jgi:oligopeptidase B
VRRARSVTDAAGANAGAADAAAAQPPVPKRVPLTMTIHGDTRVDDYFWLRDSSDPDVATYLDAENAYTSTATANTRGLQATLYAEMVAHLKETDVSAPYRRHGYWYYTRTEAGKQYAVHCRRAGELTAPEEVVLDLNELAVGKAFLGVGAFAVSDDGGYLAYSIDETGYRQYALYVKDLRSGALLVQGIERVDSVVWARDNRTLLFATEDPVTKRSDKVWRREIGGDASMLIDEEIDELYSVTVDRTRDGAFILIHSEAKDTTEVRLVAADDPTQAPRVFAARRDGIRYDVGHREGHFYVLTNEDAPDFGLWTVPAASPDRANWTSLVPQRPGVSLTGFELFADFVVVAGRRAGLASLELLVGTSRTLAPLEFDETDYVVSAGPNADYTTATFRYVYESLITPPSVYDLDVASGRRTLVKRLDVPGYDSAHYAAERVFVTARDGTEIPVSIVRRRAAEHAAAAPLLLYAYGSYGISIDASFSALRLPLLDRGVSFAIAHIRGGGEYGESWRLAGNLFHKRTTFTDFIDCAQGLIAAGHTTADRLVIQGGSAGGLLMGAVSNMRPDLFRAVIAQVPFVDVLTTMLDASLPLTTSEYREWGDPNDKAAYDYMRTYSPVDNVVAQPYPAMLIEVAYYDSQVPYWEGVKFGAKIRAFSTSANRILVRVNMGAGHGGASARNESRRSREGRLRKNSRLPAR